MVFVITSSAVQRNQGRSRWFIKAGIFLASSAVAAIAVGALLGFLGSFIAVEARASIGALIGCVLIVIGGLDILGYAPTVLEFDRETPQRWMSQGPIRASLLNGWVLGVGILSRIGFWLWYVIPFGSFLFGEVVVGAIVFGSYGALRGLFSLALMLRRTPRSPSTEAVRWLIRARSIAQASSAVQAVVIGAVAAGVAGF